VPVPAVQPQLDTSYADSPWSSPRFPAQGSKGPSSGVDGKCLGDCSPCSADFRSDVSTQAGSPVRRRHISTEAGIPAQVEHYTDKEGMPKYQHLRDVALQEAAFLDPNQTAKCEDCGKLA